MLIKSIEMINFRQYTSSKVEFATDENKNVTLVMGDNGTGKTTLAQAFLWCLYADTDFDNKEVINRKVRDLLPPGEKCTVLVRLIVNYNSIDYTIERSQEFAKVQKKVNTDKTQLNIYHKKDGNLKYLNENEKHTLIKHMLPKQLSRFFFFDGERIRIMSDEINHGKSQEFKDAVAGLVGLTSIQNAIQHLKPSSTNSTVIGYYRNRIDTEGGDKVAEYTISIGKNTDEIKKKNNRLNEIVPQIESYEKEEKELSELIMSMASEIELKKQFEDLQKEIIGLKNRKKEKLENSILNGWGVHMYDFIAAAYVNKVESILANINETNIDIPDGLEAPTLIYLLKKGMCICGEPLSPGDPHFDAVNKLLSVAPPKTTGKYVKELKDRNSFILRNMKGFYDSFNQTFVEYRELDQQIETKQAESDNLFSRMSSTDEAEKAKVKLKTIAEEKKRLSEELIELKSDIKLLEKESHRLNTEKDEYVNVELVNKKNIKYLAYAEFLYDAFTKKYTVLEQKTREKLEEKINEIFPQIYDGGLKIEVDEKYNIKVLVDDADLSDEEIEKNTAQSYSVIFAFISSIIAMAKERALSEDSESPDENEMFSEAEGYPLVMDAPLSNFDKTRIEQICTIIPSIAKQVVFFIKDTDGEVAEEHMSDRVGKKYIINSVEGSKTNSVVEEV